MTTRRSALFLSMLVVGRGHRAIVRRWTATGPRFAQDFLNIARALDDRAHVPRSTCRR
jgi:hypothetical protein